MIKNIVFDFGQVLVHFEPKYMVGAYVEDKDDASLLEEVVFDRLYWDRLDAGTISNEETVGKIQKRIPKRLWDVAEKIYYNWIYNIPEIEGMRELIGFLKENYNLKYCLLSNISKYFAENVDKVPILKELDECVMSGPIGIVKPSKEIFEHLCTKCNIEPSETIFIDDNLANIKGASEFGINTYAFDGNVEKLKEYLIKVL